MNTPDNPVFSCPPGYRKYGIIAHIIIPASEVSFINMSSRDLPIQPRVIRAKLAAGYLGMDRNRFNREVKPYLVAVPILLAVTGLDQIADATCLNKISGFTVGMCKPAKFSQLVILQQVTSIAAFLREVSSRD